MDSYVSFRSIGAIGNFASQMQQYASLTAIALETNKEIAFPIESKTDGFGLRIFDAFNIPVRYEPASFFKNFRSKTINDTLLVDESVFELEQDVSYFLDCRFDLYLYWWKHRNQIRDQFDLNWQTSVLDIGHAFLDKNSRPDTKNISVHVRRGDYMSPAHSFVDLTRSSYYQVAIDKVVNDIATAYDNVDYRILVFTDDIAWCKKNFLSETEVTYVDTGNDYADMFVMSRCDYNIIANSSFSWWGAMLNRYNQLFNVSQHITTVCPVNYLLPHSPFAHINGNYYPNTWTSI